MTAVVEGQTAEKRHYLDKACLFVIVFQRVKTVVVGDVPGQVFATTDWMITKFPHKPGHICDEIYHPFTVGCCW